MRSVVGCCDLFMQLTRRGAVVVLVVVCAVVLGALTVSGGNSPSFYRGRVGHRAGRGPGCRVRSWAAWRAAPDVLRVLRRLEERALRLSARRRLRMSLGQASSPLFPSARRWACSPVVVLGLVAYRLTGRRSVAAVTALLAAATPWLFEVSRLVFEVALERCLWRCGGYCLRLRGEADWSLRHCAAVGVVLALIAYTYAGGRASRCCFALALVVFRRPGPPSAGPTATRRRSPAGNAHVSRGCGMDTATHPGAGHTRSVPGSWQSWSRPAVLAA